MITLIKFLGNVIIKLMFLAIEINYFKINLETKLNYIKTKWFYILSDFNIKNIRMRLKLYKPTDELKSHLEADKKRKAESSESNEAFLKLMNNAFKDTDL